MIFGTADKVKKKTAKPRKTAEKQDKDLFGDPVETPEKDRPRAYHRNYMAEKRREERDIKIDWSKCNHRRRARYKDRPDLFCRHYFPDVFYRPFTPDQKVIINSIKDRILHGGRQAIAAERGGGKSSITKIVGGVWGIVYGHIKFIVILRCNGDEAKTTIEDIKRIFEKSDSLRDDFPDICDPIRAIGRTAQTAKTQTVDGEFTYLSWSATEINFPEVANSPAAGAIVICRGMNSSIRGQVRLEKRPDLVIMDDIETDDTASSVIETQKRKRMIERDVMGLAGSGKSMATLFLCTILNRRCLAYQYTDIKKNPQWNGIRQKWIKKFPTNREMWDRYIEIRRDDFADGDQFGRTAFGYYVENRDKMDVGAIVSNRWRFEPKLLPDGTPQEMSSLQAAFNRVADDGDWDSFNTEYQNDPPDEETYETLGLVPRMVAKKIGGVPRGIVPNWCEYLTAGIDIGLRTMHWTVIGWGRGMAGAVIDYNWEKINSPEGDLHDKETRRQTIDAILVALLQWRDNATEKGWPSEGNESNRRHLDKCCVDSGYMPAAIYLFAKSDLKRKYVAIRGYGTAQRSHYRTGDKQKHGIRRGFHWFGSYQRGPKCWLYQVDADHWKQFVQTGFLLPLKQPGQIQLFGSDKLVHSAYSSHICAEEWVREFKTGKGFTEGYRTKHQNNHWLDATTYAAVAASMAGAKPITISVTPDGQPIPGRKGGKISLKDKQREMKANR